MEPNIRVYDLEVNHQPVILELLKTLGVTDAKGKIKNILDEQQFEILECDSTQILKIRKKSTGEIFEAGCKFYYKKYKVWITGMYFGDELFGTYHRDTFYKNYVCGDGGMYSLDEISLTDSGEATKTMTLFEILERDSTGILKIRKKSTGEIFERGCKFYHKVYKKWIYGMKFSDNLFGTYNPDDTNINFVSGNKVGYLKISCMFAL